MKLGHILLLAGGGEARDIARGLLKSAWRVTASLHEDPRGFGPLAVPTRMGGFGGDAGFEAYLADENITAVLDATHAFASAISHRTSRICSARDIPYAQVLRPVWTAQDGDTWTNVPTVQDVADTIPADARVFTTTGRPSVIHLKEMRKAQIFLRQMKDRAPEPQDHITYVQGAPPFSVEDEMALFATLGITHLVVKNTGGAMGQSKLLAARRMGLPVILIDRPVQPKGLKLETVQEALNWTDTL